MRAELWPLFHAEVTYWAARAAERAAHLDHRSMGEAWRFLGLGRQERAGSDGPGAARALSSQADSSLSVSPVFFPG